MVKLKKDRRISGFRRGVNEISLFLTLEDGTDRFSRNVGN
jgi:hypothetical protein